MCIRDSVGGAGVVSGAAQVEDEAAREVQVGGGDADVLGQQQVAGGELRVLGGDGGEFVAVRIAEDLGIEPGPGENHVRERGGSDQAGQALLSGGQEGGEQPADVGEVVGHVHTHDQIAGDELDVGGSAGREISRFPVVGELPPGVGEELRRHAPLGGSAGEVGEQLVHDTQESGGARHPLDGVLGGHLGGEQGFQQVVGRQLDGFGPFDEQQQLHLARVAGVGADLSVGEDARYVPVLPGEVDLDGGRVPVEVRHVGVAVRVPLARAVGDLPEIGAKRPALDGQLIEDRGGVEGRGVPLLDGVPHARGAPHAQQHRGLCCLPGAVRLGLGVQEGQGLRTHRLDQGAVVGALEEDAGVEARQVLQSPGVGGLKHAGRWSLSGPRGQAGPCARPAGRASTSRCCCGGGRVRGLRPGPALRRPGRHGRR